MWCSNCAQGSSPFLTNKKTRKESAKSNPVPAKLQLTPSFSLNIPNIILSPLYVAFMTAVPLQLTEYSLMYRIHENMKN